NGGNGVTILTTPDAPADSGKRNSVVNDLIYSNGKLGIDLGDDGVTPDDPGDADSGPNTLLNFPVITSAVSTGSRVDVAVTLDSPQVSYFIQVFASPAPGPSGYGQGQQLIGNMVVKNGTGTNPPTATALFPVAIPAGWVITTTASSI